MLDIQIEEKKFKEVIFHDFHLVLPQFGFYIIMGMSGCGKTTLLNMIANIDQDYQGKIQINHQPINDEIVKEYIEYVSSLLLNELKVDDYLICDDQLIDFNRHLKIESLSKGQKQRVSLLASLNQNKPILLCDEITSGLDEKRANEVMQRLKSYSVNHLVILCMHDQELAKQYGDMVIDLKSNLQLIKEDFSRISFTLTKTNRIKKVLNNYKKYQYYLLDLSIVLILCCTVLFYFVNHSFLDEIVNELQSYFPQDAYSFEMNSEHDLDDFIAQQYVYLVMDNVELVGIQTDLNKDYYIDGYTNPVVNLEEGLYPDMNNEIVAGKEILTALNKKIGDSIQIHYMIDSKDVYISYTITGSTSGNEIYFKELGEYEYLKENYSVYCNLGMVVVENEDAFNQTIQLKDYHYLKIGETYLNRLKKTLDKVKIMILLGSSICIFVSFFALEEMIEKSVEEKRKMAGYGLMKGFNRKELFILFMKKYEKGIILSFLVINSITIFIAYGLELLFSLEITNYINLEYFILLISIYLIIHIVLVCKLIILLSHKTIELMK